MFIMLPVKVTIILQTNKHSKNFLLFLDYSVGSSVENLNPLTIR